ncbi:MerR family DNA-binding transcriptional regulator [Microlunatus speluncae]|uniref:MerR family DNA-binding transcriptional regulator n=1 Tax=Microlunatus speluncae TaxID=2594267 RepID=UPI001C2DCCE7|nr:MerR family DNA-binding transcriptional regulator [Microlunatus speluncae]
MTEELVPEELVTIGSFSMLTGLSIPTLRHYDEIGLLPPASTDPRTGYRRYGYAQVGPGRRVRLLREAELSTEDIGTILNGTAAEARVVLDRRRAELRERAGRVEAVLDRLTDTERDETPMTTAADFRLATVNLGVDSQADLEVAAAFWGEVLGTPLEDWGGGGRQVVLGEGDAIGFLNFRVRTADEPHFGHRTAFGLGVVGLEETHRRALAAGAVEQYPPSDGVNRPRSSRIEDPVGNRIVLWESAR